MNITEQISLLQVAFALLGCIPGSIGLRGTFAPQGDKQDTVKVGLKAHKHLGQDTLCCMLQSRDMQQSGNQAS